MDNWYVFCAFLIIILIVCKSSTSKSTRSKSTESKSIVVHHPDQSSMNQSYKSSTSKSTGSKSTGSKSIVVHHPDPSSVNQSYKSSTSKTTGSKSSGSKSIVVHHPDQSSVNQSYKSSTSKSTGSKSTGSKSIVVHHPDPSSVNQSTVVHHPNQSSVNQSTHVVHHPDHQHQLYSKTLNCLFVCSGCKEKGHQHFYQCIRDQCDYKLHRQCAIAPSSITHHFLGRHTLQLRYRPPPGKRNVCEACFRDVGGFVYHCEAKGWNLHPCCAKLDPVVKTGVEGVELQLNRKMKSKCRWCGIKKPHGRPSGWSYISQCGNFHFHVGCIKEAFEESWSKAQLKSDEGCGSDLALKVRPPSKGIVLHDDDGIPILDLVKYDGKSKVKQRLKIYWQLANTLFRGVLSVLLGTPPSMEVIQLMATVFRPKY